MRRPVALLLALHGYGSDGAKMESYSGFDELAERDRFAVAYPSSASVYWNSTAAKGLPDDVRFLSRLIGELEASLCIDRTRVFATGVSNGGGMVALAACELSGRIAAIAPVAGDYSRQPPCRPRRPVSVLEIHGTNDRTAPYFGPSRRPSADGLPPFVGGWRRRDRCAPRPTARRLAARAAEYRFGGCAGGSVVEHIRIAGGAHQWPGAHPPDPGPPSPICASCAIWGFLSSLRTANRTFAGSAAR